MKFKDSQTEIFSEAHYNQVLRSQRQIILKAAREQKTHHIQGNPGKAIRKFLTRNLVVQKRVGCYIQSAKKKKS